MEQQRFADRDLKLAKRLRRLRLARGWSLDDLAKDSAISRATLSRLENCTVSPTASVLGRLCAVYGLTMSRLMSMVEECHTPLVPCSEQSVWIDANNGFERRSVSPPAENLACEVLECCLPAGTIIEYESPAKAGLEHHLVMREGELEMAVEGQNYQLKVGDCLRYRLHGSSRFKAHPSLGATYMLVIV